MQNVIVNAEIEAALADRRPIVALESTLIAQGLPWPENLSIAGAVENAVRQAGAHPATIAVMGGQIRVGLASHELEVLASGQSFVKAGRRELGAAIAQGRNAATTVSATLWIARSLGISIMATGGIGGVHRDAATSFDISMDLDELARADGTLVVCSGIKSLLDLPATLEALETRGVAVVGYRTSELPAFTTLTSGLMLDWRVETPAEAAGLLKVHRSLGLPGAILLTQAVPEVAAIDQEELERSLAAAAAEAREKQVAGKFVTPFLLERIRSATAGRSLRANQALVIANAGLAGAVATAFNAP
jgi:pseudouridine-5'-phosphate glycosidase